MKGMVFTQFLAMADASIGERRVDSMLDRCPLSSGGAYSSVGKYDCRELYTLLDALSDEVRMDVDSLQIRFGRWMFRNFVETYPAFFTAKTTAFDMLESVEGEVHVEVRKLHPDAELPQFDTYRPDDRTLAFAYRSPRGLVSFCRGLIEACLEHYGEQADITCETGREGVLYVGRFLLTLKSVAEDGS